MGRWLGGICMAVGLAMTAAVAPAALASPCAGCMVYVAGFNDALTPIKMATNTPLAPIRAPMSGLAGFAIQPGGQNAYVAFDDGGPRSHVVRLHIATRTWSSPIADDWSFGGIALSPNGRSYYTVHDKSPSRSAHSNLNEFGAGARGSLRVPAGMTGISVTPAGTEALLLEGGFFATANLVVPVNLVTSAVGTPIPLPSTPWAIAVRPDGRFAYAVSNFPNEVTPIDLATDTARTPIAVGGIGDLLGGVALTNDTAYVVDNTRGAVIPIDLATNTPKRPIRVGRGPEGIAVDPGLTRAYVANTLDDTVTPIVLATGRTQAPIHVPGGPREIAIVR